MNKVISNFKKNVNKINSICDTYQPLLQSIGFMLGLYLIFSTYQSINISNEQLKIAYEELNIIKKQEIQKQLPIWEFEVNDSLSFAHLKPFSPDVKLEQATAYFSKKLFYNKLTKWKIDQPKFNLNLSAFKSYATKFILENTKYSDSTLSVGMRNDFPIGLEISYVQFGELKNIYAIFTIQYTSVRTSKNYVSIHLDGIRFNRYIYNDENLISELDQIIENNYYGFKY
ncbi:conserved hypothetical protein [Flavobacterium sp. 9AF]|uniref:hypothetical protein n=1 Tax=Flavobacterium sp. 9AF TaxID=2653142 RepID=UPI0012EF0348|nr:hypothetical protein [Flavobacterium sp. 9AF]VXB58204.1 conserved hypothetical protein [Flavobacterium sp. 9AF]